MLQVFQSRNSAELSYNFDLSKFTQLVTNPFDIQTSHSTINVKEVITKIVKDNDPTNEITAICKTEEEVNNHLDSLN